MRTESVLTIDQGLRRLLYNVQQLCVSSLQLKACALPAELARLEGDLDGQPLTLTTWRYRGQLFSAFTVAALELAQRLRSLTVIGLPPPGAPWPVLGIDLIALRGAISLVALDLAPTDDAFWVAHCAQVLSDVRACAGDAIIPRRTPRFTEGVFSPLALIAGAHAGGEASIFAATESLLNGTTWLLRRAALGDFTTEARVRRDRWLAAEKQNRKEHNALERMFGAAAARRYLDEFLFATSQGAA